MKERKEYLSIAAILLMIITSGAGILSINFNYATEVLNQYNQTVKMYGFGIYAHDTYFQAPVSIGTDVCILMVVVPLFIYSYISDLRKRSRASALRLISIYGVSLYYAASIAFGLAFNRLFLFYVALFSCSLFGMFWHIIHLKSGIKAVSIHVGLKVFLILSGLALLLAWMPDVIPALVKGTTLSSIGIYTTGVTYIIDMGIVSPLCFVCLYLLTRKNPIGTIVLSVMLKLCMVVGIMMIPQTLCQYASGCELPLPALITKSFSFVLLGLFAFIFNRTLYREIGE